MDDGVNVNTALNIAALRGHSDTARLFMELGANVKLADRLRGVTPLYNTANGGHAGIVRMLLLIWVMLTQSLCCLNEVQMHL